MLNNLFHILFPNYISPHDRIISQYRTQFSPYLKEKLYLSDKANDYYVSIIDLVKSYIAPTDILLDLGCGLGRVTFDCSATGGKKVIGIDTSEVLINEARRISKGTSSYIQSYSVRGNYEFIQGDAHALPFASESIDMILCSNLIDRIAKPKDAAVEIFRVLKTGGIFINSDPYDWYEQYTEKELWASDIEKLLPRKAYKILQRKDIEFIYPIYSRRATVYLNDVCVIKKI